MLRIVRPRKQRRQRPRQHEPHKLRLPRFGLEEDTPPADETRNLSHQPIQHDLLLAKQRPNPCTGQTHAVPEEGDERSQKACRPRGADDSGDELTRSGDAGLDKPYHIERQINRQRRPAKRLPESIQRVLFTAPGDPAMYDLARDSRSLRRIAPFDRQTDVSAVGPENMRHTGVYAVDKPAVADIPERFEQPGIGVRHVRNLPRVGGGQMGGCVDPGVHNQRGRQREQDRVDRAADGSF